MLAMALSSPTAPLGLGPTAPLGLGPTAPPKPGAHGSPKAWGRGAWPHVSPTAGAPQLPQTW